MSAASMATSVSAASMAASFFVLMVTFGQAELNILGSWEDSSGHTWSGLAAAGDFAYVASQSGLFKVVNIADPSSPTIAGSVHEPYHLSVATDIKIAGKYAYVAAFRMAVVDITNASNPTRVDATVNGTMPPSDALAVVGNLAYVASGGTFSTPGTMAVVDITTPSNFVVLGSIQDEQLDESLNIEVVGNFAFLCTYRARFVSVDITDPSNITIAYSFVDFAMFGAKYMAIAGQQAFVLSELMNGLFVVDISNPLSTSVLGNLQVANRPTGIAIDGNYAYVGVSGGGIIAVQVINISDPSNLSAVDDLSLGTVVDDINGIAFVGEHLCVTSRVGGAVLGSTTTTTITTITATRTTTITTTRTTTITSTTTTITTTRTTTITTITATLTTTLTTTTSGTTTATTTISTTTSTISTSTTTTALLGQPDLDDAGFPFLAATIVLVCGIVGASVVVVVVVVVVRRRDSREQTEPSPAQGRAEHTQEQVGAVQTLESGDEQTLNREQDEPYVEFAI